MQRMKITIVVSRNVREKIWRDVFDNRLGQMQAQAIARGLGTSWKCEFRHGGTTYFVGQEGAQFCIHKQGDTEADLRNGTIINATALGSMTLEEYTQNVRDVLQEKADATFPENMLAELLQIYKTVVFIGFTNDVPVVEVADQIITSVRSGPPNTLHRQGTQ